MLNRIPQSEIRNADEFLTPILEDNPCGPYIKRDPVLTRLKELRAIVTETSSGPWKPKEKLGDTVGESIQLSEEFLKKTSKDLTVGTYYTESLTKKYGFFGLDQGLSVIYALCETYWDKVNPDLSAENAPLRITAFKLLQKILVDQLNFAPIVITTNNEQMCALDILKKEKGHEPTKAKNKIISALAREQSDDLNFFKEKLENSIKILNALSARSEELDRLLETQEAPNFAKQVEILKLVLELINSALNPQALQLAEAAIPGSDQATEEVNEVKMGDDSSIKSIQDAYKMIEKINEYLIKNDSHSPCPSLIKRATEWRKKDIFELYADIFASISRPDELFALLALKPKPQPNVPETTGTPAALPPSPAPPMGGAYPPAGGGGYEPGGYPPSTPPSPYGGTPASPGGGSYGAGNPYGGGGNPYGGGGNPYGGGGYGGGNPYGSGGGFG